MKPHHIAALMLLGWALIVTEPSPRTVKTGFQTREACETAAEKWRDNYKRQLKQANQRTGNPNRRRRLAQAVPPTKCVDEANANLPPA
jgi:hypothetical protein